MRLGYIILYVSDVTATVEFYERAFGLIRRFIHDSGAYAELETGTTALAFAEEGFVASAGHRFRPNRAGDEAAGAEIALVVADVQEAFDRALAAGAENEHAPERKPWGQIVSYVRDCNGFLVELCSEIGE